MRWKVVFLKKPEWASDTIEALAFGALFRSSFTVKEPQFVLKVSVHALEALSGCVGFFAPPFGLGLGAETCLQPVDGGFAAACVGVGVVSLPAGMSAVFEPESLEPHAPSVAATASSPIAAPNLMQRPRLALTVMPLSRLLQGYDQIILE